MSEQSRTPINGPKESPQYASETTFKPISPATDRKPYTQAISTQYDGSNGRSSSTGRMTTWHGMTAVGRQVQQLMLNRRQQYEDDRQRLDLQYQQDIHQYQNLMNGVGGLVQSTYSRKWYIVTISSYIGFMIVTHVQRGQSINQIKRQRPC